MALQVQTAGTGVVRDAHYVTPTGASAPVRTLLLEPQRTNALLRSEEFNDAAWAKSAATVTANAAVAPDGATTADKIVESATTAGHYINQTLTTVIGTTYTTSVYLKASERSAVRLSRNGGAVASSFNLAAGTVSDAAGSTGVIVAFGNGWYRCSITFAGATVADAVYIELQTTPSTSIESYAGDGTSGVFVWGAQQETAVVPSSYIPTAATTITRNADSLFWALSSLVPREMTVYVRGVNVGTFVSAATSRGIWNIGAAAIATDPRLVAFVDSATTGTVLVTYDDGTTAVSSSRVLSATPVLFDVIELRSVLSSSWTTLSAGSVNGAAEVVGSASAASGPAAAFADARFYLNSSSGINSAPFAYTNVAIALGTKTRAEMRAIAGV